MFIIGNIYKYDIKLYDKYQPFKYVYVAIYLGLFNCIYDSRTQSWLVELNLFLK